MVHQQSYLSSFAELSGVSEGRVLMVCGTALAAGSATALVAGVRAADAVLAALPRTR